MLLYYCVTDKLKCLNFSSTYPPFSWTHVWSRISSHVSDGRMKRQLL